MFSFKLVILFSYFLNIEYNISLNIYFHSNSVTGLLLHVSIICVIIYFVRLEVASISADCPEWFLIIKMKLITLGADSGLLFVNALKTEPIFMLFSKCITFQWPSIKSIPNFVTIITQIQAVH